MDLIKNFGINYYLLVAQIANFLILLYLLKRFAYKPIFKMLEDRKKIIAEGIKNTEESRIALEKALAKEKELLKNAQGSAQQILADAKNQADQLLNDARDQAKEQVDQILSNAKEEIAQNAKAMEKQLAFSTANLAVKMVEDALEGVFTKKEQQEAIKRMTKKLPKGK